MLPLFVVCIFLAFLKRQCLASQSRGSVSSCGCVGRIRGTPRRPQLETEPTQSIHPLGSSLLLSLFLPHFVLHDITSLNFLKNNAIIFLFSFLFFQALESKLASCRNFVKDQPRNPRGSNGSSSPSDSPRYAFEFWLIINHHCKGYESYC